MAKAKWTRIDIPARYQGREDQWIAEQSNPEQYRRAYEPGYGYVVEQIAGKAKLSTKGANIGTGNVVSAYIRPGLRELTKKEFEDATNAPTCKKLSLNMWSFDLHKNPRVRGAYATSVIVRRLGKYYLTVIPTDKKGLVPQLLMAERLMDVESGDRSGHMRNVMIDCSVDALKVTEDTDKAKVYYWFIYPNETDVKYIDDSHTKIVEILKSGKNGTGRSSRILITGGTAAQRDQIAKSLSENFTVREKYLINNCLIEIVSNSKPYAGCFSGSADSQGNPIGTPKILITEAHTDQADVVVHEAIHALREFDPKRDTRLRAVKHYSGKDADLEESLTEAETTGRETPFKRGDNYKAGYYHYIKIPGKNSGEMVTEDRVTITGEKNKGQKGKRVQKSLLLRYPMTNIAKLKLKGSAEAIDTYYEVGNRKQGIQEASRSAAATVFPKRDHRVPPIERTLGAGNVPDIGSPEKPVISPSGLPAYRKDGFWYYRGYDMAGSGKLSDHYNRVTDPRSQKEYDNMEILNYTKGRHSGDDKLNSLLNQGSNTGEAKQKIHMYAPAANEALDRRQDKALDAETSEKIIQYQDEKPVVVDEGETTPAASSGITRSRDPKFRSKPPANFNPGGNHRKKKTGKARRLGPYYQRGGRLSRHKC